VEFPVEHPIIFNKKLHIFVLIKRSNLKMEENDIIELDEEFLNDIKTISKSNIINDDKKKKLNKIKSEVWDYFIQNNETNVVSCTLCPWILNNYNKDHGTNQFWNHLEKEHDSYYKLTRKMSKVEYQFKQKVFISKCVKLVVKENLPLTFTGKESFKELVQSLNPRAVPPSYETIKNNLEELKESFYKFAKKCLENIDYIAFTSDLWSSIIMEHFVDLTATYINENFEIVNMLICVKELDEVNACAENILNEFKEILESYNLLSNEKTLFFTTDRGKNLVKSIKLGASIFNWNLINCICHIYDNIITFAMGKFNILKKVKFIVSAFKRSTKLSGLLKQEQLDDKVKIPLRPTQDVKTRWSCKFYLNNSILFTFTKIFTFA
jgi:hypothetical protein